MFAPSARPDPVSVSTYATNGVRQIRHSQAGNFTPVFAWQRLAVRVLREVLLELAVGVGQS